MNPLLYNFIYPFFSDFFSFVCSMVLIADGPENIVPVKWTSTVENKSFLKCVSQFPDITGPGISTRAYIF